MTVGVVTLRGHHPLCQSLEAPPKPLPSKSCPFATQQHAVWPAVFHFSAVLAHSDLLLLLCRYHLSRLLSLLAHGLLPPLSCLQNADHDQALPTKCFS